MQIEVGSRNAFACVSPRHQQSAGENRRENERGHPMPRVEISVAEVCEKTEKSGDATDGDRPPRPRLAPPKRKFGEPQIHRSDRDEHTGERDAIVNHEMHDATAVQRAELLRRHAEVCGVVRKKVAGRGLEECEAAGADENERSERQQRTSVADERVEKSAIVAHQKRSFTGTIPARSRYGSSRRASSGQL